MKGEALVIVGHGSQLNPRSSEPAYDHAGSVRDRDAFDEVRVAFWKEEPSLRDVLRTVRSDTVYVVPLFVSEGYFVDEVIPREMRLEEDTSLRVDKDVRYTPPVGTQESMTDVILERALGVYEGDDKPALAVVGHGTERNPNSADAVYEHAERARDRGDFADVKALFMDEEPEIDDVTDHFAADDIVVVPMFVADGYHTQEDIPEDVGMVEDASERWETPAVVDGKRVWYSGAVGTEPLVADVIVERAADAGASCDADAGRRLGGHERWFVDRLAGAGGAVVWGELRVSVHDDGYELRNVADVGAEADELESHEPGEVHELVKYTDDGAYRPLKGERTLPTGWVVRGTDETQLVDAVERVYPASIANAYLDDRGELDVTPWRETAERQTGRYSDVDELDGDELRCAVDAVCGNCVRRPLWHEDAGDDEIPCREACSFFVAAARAFLRVEDEAPTEPSHEVRVGEFSEQGNVYRERYLRNRQTGVVPDGGE